MAQIGDSPKNNQDKKKNTNVNENVDALDIPVVGVEPTLPCGNWILSSVSDNFVLQFSWFNHFYHYR